MLELFDTGRLAHKCGKWRGLVYLVAAAAPLAIAYFLGTVFTVLPGAAQPADVLQWLKLGLGCGAAFLAIYGCYRLYRDHEHHDYIEDADHYRHHGW